MFGGLFGRGIRKRCRRAYHDLCEQWDQTTPEDRPTIDIIGFSRGAATAIHFANVIAKYGIKPPRGRWSSWMPRVDTLLGLQIGRVYRPKPASDETLSFPRFPGSFWLVDHATASVGVWRCS